MPNKTATADTELKQVEKSISKAKSSRWEAFAQKSNERIKGTVTPPDKTSLAEQTIAQAEEHKNDPEKIENPVIKTEPIIVDNKPEKKKPFLQTKMQEAEQAKKDAADFKAKYEAAATEKTVWETEKAELTRKLEEATSNPEITKLQEQLRDREKLSEGLTTEKTALEQRLEVLDTINSPTFIRKYTEPVQGAYKSVATVLNSEPEAMIELGKAINAQEAAMAAGTPEEKLRQENLRDTIINGIYENLIPSKQGRFITGMESLNVAQESYFNALANNQQTVAEIKKENDRQRIEHDVNFKNTWAGAFEKAEKTLASEITYPEEVAKVIKEKKIDDNTEIDMAIAKDTIMGGVKFAPDDVARIMVQGANANRYKAQLVAKDAMIAELNETINKFRGTNTTGSKTQENHKEVQKTDVVHGSRQWAIDKFGVTR